MPDATLLEGELTALLPSLPRSSYDVATLCEVLYYMADPADALASAQSLARHVIVTLYEPQARRLAPLLQGEGWQEAPPHHGRAQTVENLCLETGLGPLEIQFRWSRKRWFWVSRSAAYFRYVSTGSARKRRLQTRMG